MNSTKPNPTQFIEAVTTLANAHGNKFSYFVIKFDGQVFFPGHTGHVRLYASKGAAKSAFTSLIQQIFWHADYWSNYAKTEAEKTAWSIIKQDGINNPADGYTSKERPIQKKRAQEIVQQYITAGRLEIIPFENLTL